LANVISSPRTATHLPRLTQRGNLYLRDFGSRFTIYFLD
jgi:hypothetical protein